MKSIAIITARGGSKRIPKKNIKDFLGKPIIAYSIEAALKSQVFDEIIVSTDSEEIAEVARTYGAKVPFLRTKKTSDDYATTADVIEEVLSEYKKNKIDFDFFACIYPTAPFITEKKLAEAVELLHDGDAVISVVQYSFPPQRAYVVRDGKLSFQYPEFIRSRSQDLEPIYHECGQFYFCKTEEFLKNKSLLVERTIPYIVSAREVQDIDTQDDWRIAELKYLDMRNNNKAL